MAHTNVNKETGMDALIGRTGFVGGTLLRQRTFAAAYNRANIHEACEHSFETVICAAAPGSMFEANRFPEADTAAVEALIEHLDTLRTEHFVLISTIAVLADFASGADEATDDFQDDLAYGRNRRRLEVFCTQRFAHCTILRLPALFGPGLRKNFLFDVANPIPSMLTRERLNETCARLPSDLRDAFLKLYKPDPRLDLMVVDRTAVYRVPATIRTRIETILIDAGRSSLGFTNPNSEFQYYDMDGLSSDIARAQAAKCDLLHLAPEPVRAGTLFKYIKKHEMPEGNARLHHENMRTRHANLWQREGPYTANATEVMSAIKHFMSAGM